MTEEQEIARLVEVIGSKKMLRLERWRDQYKHWRVGLEWYSEEDYEYLVEAEKLIDALRSAAHHLKVL